MGSIGEWGQRTISLTAETPVSRVGWLHSCETFSMARSPRITIPTLPHHILQRGNNRQAVFFDDDDYRLYLECLRQAKEKCSCRIYAYVLMTNHVHVLVEPTNDK